MFAEVKLSIKLAEGNKLAGYQFLLKKVIEWFRQASPIRAVKQQYFSALLKDYKKTGIFQHRMDPACFDMVPYPGYHYKAVGHHHPEPDIGSRDARKIMAEPEPGGPQHDYDR